MQQADSTAVVESRAPRSRITLLSSAIVLVLAALLAFTWSSQTQTTSITDRRTQQANMSAPVAESSTVSASSSSANSTWRAPSYFISHGGPPTMFMGTHPAYHQWASLGTELKSLHADGKLKGLVFVSAHWQAEDLSSGVYVNVDEENPLIYDFYNFPPDFYEVSVHSRNPSWLSTKVLEHLRARGVDAQPIKRGVDHGVWVPLKVAFGNGKPDSHASALPEGLPLVQVSLPRSEEGIDSLRLGRALRSLRDEGFAVVGGGQAVHNLRDFSRRRATGDLTEPQYAKTFPPALTAALVRQPNAPHGDDATDDGTPNDAWSTPAEEKWGEALRLDAREDFKHAHPTAEHFLPTLVSLGASYPNEGGIQILDLSEGPLGWNMYRWDSVARL